ADLLGPDFTPAPLPPTPLPGDDVTIVVERFEVVGSTVFAATDFDPITANYLNRPITFAEVIAVRDAISDLYRERGYLTSGAIVPPQALTDGVVQIQVVEGSVEDIVVTGTTRLRPSYISSRVGLGAQAPLQIDRLLESLQLLQLNPLIEQISADLQAGTRPGTNLLAIAVTEADSFKLDYTLDNNRSPSVGSIRHQLAAREGNLTGWGDALRLSATATQGSEEWAASYTLPLSPRNTTLAAYFSTSQSDVIEDPFDVLEISSEATVAELTLRHPLVQTPTQELALGLVASHQRTQTFWGFDDFGGFPLSAGADEEGVTQVTALRFFQEWTQRSTRQVIAVRSQFNLGLGALGASISDDPDIPDSQFFSWQGQGQWVRLLAPDTPLIVRGSVQLSSDQLLTLERYGLGGQATVRGYRQDALLTDNGAALSGEVRFPLWRDPQQTALLQIAPFIDSGLGWNNRGPDPDPNLLLSVGTGLLLQVSDATLRADWGIPLISQDSDANTLQEQGLYFSLNFSFL
ncbi:MAG TPA: ShlB/FhaC/HecB family hemolysin secretion/activation protein, partial [Candidatus Obscuribacterales bacterium]